MEFAHLHVHSPYSFLDGASRIRKLVRRAADLGQPALALTDRDNLCGAVELLEETEKAGLRPILGAEVTVEPLGRRGTAPSDGSRAGAARATAAPAAPRGYPLVLLAAGERGYRQLSRLLTRAHLENPRGEPRATAAMLEEAAARSAGELLALTGGREGEIPARLLAGDRPGALAAARALAAIFRAGDGGRGTDLAGRAASCASGAAGTAGRPEPGPLGVELINPRVPGGRRLLAELAELAEHLGLPLVAGNDVRHAERDAYIVHDLLSCLRAKVDVSTPHPLRPLNAEHDLKSGEEMRDMFRAHPEAVAEAGRWAERLSAQPSLRLGRERELHPEFAIPDGADADEMLRREVYDGAVRRYGRVGEEERRRLEHELSIIRKLELAPYFLLVWDVARFAAREGIRYAGRGSAADSAVAYCLGITNVDAIGRGLLFERFLSLERAEKPDIDIDFDARRRDDVTEYVYRRYGREHVANVATFNTFRGRSALRDLGKALGMPEAEVDRFAKRVPYMVTADGLAGALEKFPELRESGLDRAKFEILLQAAAGVAGLPRHLSTHLGGVVISREPVAEILPIQMAAKGVPIIQADRDGVEALGLVKLDLLSLRTLAAVEQANAALGAPDYDAIPPGDRATYRMLNEGRTVGVFQLESPAQRALQSRLGADRFEDLVASVAIIRPGPIKGNMVEPFIRRRLGEEPVSYLHPKLEPILKKTYGVVLFQEQVIDVARAIAGFTPGEADRLRRTMSHARSHEEMTEIGRLFVEKAVGLGVEREVAGKIFECLAGYASYGFNEAHAAAFADTAYRTAYLVRHHPAEFFAAILSQQPMGYYPLHTVVTDARSRGVGVLGPDVTRSGELCAVERGAGASHAAIRLGLALVAGLSEKARARIVAEREREPYRGILDFLARAAPDRDEAQALALSGALDALSGGRRRPLLWALPEAYRRLEEARPLPIAAGGGAASGDAAGRGDGPRAMPGAVPGVAPRALPDPPDLLPAIPDFTPEERVAHEWETLGIPVTAHPMSFWRARLSRKGYITSREAARARQGQAVKVAGLPVRPHRPPTRSGRIIVYVSLEDEWGLVDVVLFEDIYQRDGGTLFGDRLPAVAVEGVVERRGRGVQVVARRVAALGRRTSR